MLEHKTIQSLDDFFVELNNRKEKGVYFYRINGYSETVGAFISKYYDEARKSGVIIEGKIPNPDEKNLSYYNEIMGTGFQMDPVFIDSSLKKWLPRMNDFQRKNVSDSIYDSLLGLQKNGKNENMLKNAYIKFMCWLYYKFERIVNRLGENSVPKILYEGNISNYELMLISIISNAGCDVVLLQYSQDAEYLKVDPESKNSIALPMEGLGPFPSGYSLKQVREDMQAAFNNQRLYGEMPKFGAKTNEWVSGKALDDVRSSVTLRGKDASSYYNCYYRITGVEDKLTYANELFQLHQELLHSKRKVVVVNKEIPKPSNDEIMSISRGNYQKLDQLISGLAANIQYPQSNDLREIMKKAFIDVILDESKSEQNLNRLTNKAVYILSWIKRYQFSLFGNWKMPDIACFIYFGACANDNEALFMKFLSKLPTDVLIVNPNLNVRCCLTDSKLKEQSFTNTLNIEKYPTENSRLHIGTAAFHAERELDTLMYQDTGMYRNKQHSSANIVSLQTMYEEIAILWNEEVKYRPNFSTSDGVANIPVVFAKVSGVKDSKLNEYWLSIKQLVSAQDVTFVCQAPFIKHGVPNPIRAVATDFFKNGKLQRNKIKNHPAYQYSILREEMQDFLLDKLQFLIDDKLIKGTFENGMEYTIVATALNLPKEMVRQIQKFDFTKKNPKLVYLNTKEELPSIEDAILVAFLNLIGFDVVFFAPTGYQYLEKYYTKKIMEEHQIGDYMYDLEVPDFNEITSAGAVSGLFGIFKKK